MNTTTYVFMEKKENYQYFLVEKSDLHVAGAVALYSMQK